MAIADCSPNDVIHAATRMVYEVPVSANRHTVSWKYSNIHARERAEVLLRKRPVFDRSQFLAKQHK